MDQTQAIEVLHRLLDQSTLPVAIADWKGRLTVFNSALEQLTGYGAQEVLGERAAMFYESSAVAEEIRQRATKDGKIEDFETLLLGKHGRKIPISLMATVLLGESGKPFGIMALIKDLTERHGLEDSLRLTSQRADFSNDLMTHDIRNYAQTISGYLETMLAGQVGAVGPDQSRLLKVCRRQAQRIEGLINNLQLLLKAHDGCQVGVVPEFQNWPLAPSIQTALGRTRELYSDRQVALIQTLPDDCEVLACVHFPQVLNNLFANAVGHNPSQEPRIWVTADPIIVNDAPGWAIGIADDGPGISPEIRARLMDTNRPFQRGDSGVGLWVIKALLHKCGGTLRCEDRVDGAPDRGTRFIALLRAVPDEDPVTHSAQETSP